MPDEQTGSQSAPQDDERPAGQSARQDDERPAGQSARQDDERPAGQPPARAQGHAGEEAAGQPKTDPASFRRAAFAAVIVVVLFAGYGLGRLSNSAERVQATSAALNNSTTTAPHDDTGAAPHVHTADGTNAQPATAEAVGGLTITSAGLTLVPEATSLKAASAQPYRFRITGPGGAPITTYAVVHDKPLHFVLVRRDLTGFQHLHPTMAPDGTWSVDLALTAPGSYRAITDFTAVVGGRQTPVTLGVDLTVGGDYRPVPLPAPVTEATTDGFVISYAGTPRTTATQPLLMTVTGPDGKPATLEPYLGAFGHLVVLREGDVGYVHVHPEAQPVDGAVKFWLTAPGPGRYRMFFDFQVAGKVHTAAFTTVVR
ncbi:hypothetical protein AB0C29_07375 [Actinoplanes sp. NPDC048791]|uniref:hypothetical protein n=1 Tax=Actinoplanes sp. NPDC048791 TaxID=3154623 RepID=UPI0033F8CE32